MSTPETAVQEWRDIDWAAAEKDVHGLQRRIYRASRKEDGELIHRLQRLLLSSWTAKTLAVRKVTQDNQGKKTAGIDGVSCLDPEERLLLVSELSLEARPQPVRRVWIPKPGTDEKRPLGIPTMYDRALQALVKLALEPEWEARFEPNSYGFRPGRSAHDAIEAIFKAIKQCPKYVLDADIAKCFDRIDQNALLDKLQTFPIMRRVIKAWLEAGVLDGDTLFPTKVGSPQGGVISPLLANVALHGLGQAIAAPFNAYKRIGDVGAKWKPTTIRYADDFVVLHRDEGVIQECQAIAQEWLKGVGLELKPSKTHVVHTLKMDGKPGFNFLGFTVRQFPVGMYRSGKTGRGEPLGFKTITTPQKERVKLHAEKLSEVVRRMRNAPQQALIKTLNPIIKGWCGYYRSVCSAKTFNKMDEVLHRMLTRWAARRHPKKSRSWVAMKYWRYPEWIFGAKEGQTLIRHSKTKIIRHIGVRGEKSPFDGDWTYWASRQAHYPGVTPWVAGRLKKQQGRCLECGMLFLPDDLIEEHHVYHDLDKKNWHLELLHRHCHDKRPAPEYRLAPTE
jgi:RNA-directed DNA polymerase